MILYNRLLTRLDEKMGSFDWVAPEKAPLGVTHCSFGTTKPHASRLAYKDVGKERENGCGSFAYRDGKDCSRQSLYISTIHGGHSKERENGSGSFDWCFFRGNSNNLIPADGP